MKEVPVPTSNAGLLPTRPISDLHVRPGPRNGPGLMLLSAVATQPGVPAGVVPRSNAPVRMVPVAVIETASPMWIKTPVSTHGWIAGTGTVTEESALADVAAKPASNQDRTERITRIRLFILRNPLASEPRCPDVLHPRHPHRTASIFILRPKTGDANDPGDHSIS